MTAIFDIVYFRWEKRLVNWIVLASALVGLLWLVLNPGIVSAFSSLGGYVTEKTLGGAATPEGTLTLSTGEGSVVLASVPRITTGTAVTDSTGTTATLSGTVASLNSAPSALVWFEWGYAANALVHSTPSVSVTTTGEKTASLTGYEPNKVFYRMAASTDGVTYGDVASFIPGGSGSAFYLLANVLTTVMALGIVLVSLRFSGGNMVAAGLYIITGLVFIALVRIAVLGSW